MRYSAILVSATLALLSVGQAAPADTPAAPVEVITIPFPDADTLASLPNSTDSFAPADVDKKVARRAWETASLDKRQLPDRRYRVPDTDAWPLRTSGRWTRPDGVICSGVLVGPRHVLTARHCMGPNPGDMHFQPRYPAQNRGGAYVARVYQYPSSPAPCSQATDYVVLALGEELGHRAGWMGVGKFDGRYNAGQYCSLGYPGDRDNGGQMWATDGVSIHFLGTGCGNNVNQLSRNTLTAGGMSGGPLWGWTDNNEPYTIGPLVGLSSTESDWVGGDGVVALVSHARSDWS